MHEERKRVEEKWHDDMQALGFALATSLSMLQECSTVSGPNNCLDVALVKKMDGVCCAAKDKMPVL